MLTQSASCFTFNLGCCLLLLRESGSARAFTPPLRPLTLVIMVEFLAKFLGEDLVDDYLDGLLIRRRNSAPGHWGNVSRCLAESLLQLFVFFSKLTDGCISSGHFFLQLLD